jgi:FKBP-type peptidyl-prolyl cis-trans isomerase SlyD
MKITPGSVVRIEYEIRVKGGDVIESSTKSGPVQYVHGEGKLLPALEKRLEGLSAGQTLEGDIPAAEAVPEDSLPTRTIPRAEFPSSGPLEVGSAFEAHTAGGGVVNLRIVAVDEKHVTARLLPPLAGKDLAFKVKVVRIEDPVSHLVSIVQKPPPPLPAEAVKLELEADED